MRNTTIFASLTVLASALVMSGCSRTTPNPNIPVGKAAYDLMPAETAPDPTYLIRPLDQLSVRVFREPELSADAALVDEAGKINLPLIGSVDAVGKNVTDLESLIAVRLGDRYLVNPQVNVTVRQMAPRFASVEGEVANPGVYQIDAKASLLSVIARAGSPSSVAKLSEIVVFRTIDGERMVARFDLKDIRTGISPDPRILENDVIMVGFSVPKEIYSNILKAAPLLNIWTRYTF